MNDAPPQLIHELRAVVGPQNVLTDRDLVAPFVRDWTGRFDGSTPAVVRPAETAEVSAVLRLCHGAEVAVVPQGGNTGLVGGSVPLDGEIVLSLSRLVDVGGVDRRAGQLTAAAGVTLASVQEAAGAAGWRYGIDLAARDTATIGGSVATNASGLHALRYGTTRRQLVGYEAVLADGTVLRHLGGLENDNTGYDLAGLLAGSEGTLAVVTAARLRLVPEPGERATALLAFASVADAVDAIGMLREDLESLLALEIFLEDGLRLVVDRFRLRSPFSDPHAAFLLVEIAGPDDPVTALDRAVSGVERVRDAAVATSVADREALWQLRERHTEAISLVGVPLKLDVAIPLAHVPAFCLDVSRVITERRADARMWIFGHAGEGNLHVNVTGYADDDVEGITADVLGMVSDLGGSISAEHGIGRAKAAYLGLSRSDEEIATFAQIKRALDPRGILNPGVLFAGVPPGERRPTDFSSRR